MKRAVILAVPLALALVAGACGDDDDSPDDTDPAETSVETDGTEGTSTDDTILPGGTVLPGGTALPGGTVLPGGTALPGGTLPDFSIPDNAEDLISEVFPGLDEDQVSCLVENMGADIDPTQAMELLDECNIQIEDLAPG